MRSSVGGWRGKSLIPFMECCLELEPDAFPISRLSRILIESGLFMWADICACLRLKSSASNLFFLVRFQTARRKHDPSASSASSSGVIRERAGGWTGNLSILIPRGMLFRIGDRCVSNFTTIKDLDRKRAFHVSGHLRLFEIEIVHF